MPKKFGADTHKCRRCGKTSGVIRNYGLLYCRQRFEAVAPNRLML